MFSSQRAKWLLGIISTSCALLLALLILRGRSVRRDAVHRGKIAVVQELLRLESDVGFLWQKNIDVLFSEQESWLDHEAEGIDREALVTDGDGFKNHPDAIRKFRTRSPDIIGLGDSFMHDAACEFYRLFSGNGLFYYSFAMHRHCPPQYNSILKKYGLQKIPGMVIYTLYVNDFVETQDFYRWGESGLDWFSYHGGYWCGAGRDRAAPQSSGPALYEDVVDCVIEAAEICESHEIDFTLMLIPSKEFVISGVRSSIYETEFYSRIADESRRRGIPVVDLREIFLRAEDPARLYWKSDAHWSYEGMALAVRTYLSRSGGIARESEF